MLWMYYILYVLFYIVYDFVWGTFNRYVMLLVGTGNSWFSYETLRKNGGEGENKLYCAVSLIKKND